MGGIHSSIRLDHIPNERNNISNFISVADTVDLETNQNNILNLLEHQKSKITKTYKNPIVLMQTSLKLEKDSIDPNLYYFSFNYTSLLPFDVIFHFNSLLENNNIIKNSDFPSIIISDLPPSNESYFFYKEACVNIKNYFDSKSKCLLSNNCWDVIIELRAFKENKIEECSYFSLCNLIPFKLDSKSNYSVKIKCETQKLKVRNYMFEVYSIFGLDPSIDSSSNDCEACCTKKKNTIFLPCKHSYSCSECSTVVRLPNNQCPLCRQPVTDCLIID